MNGKRGRPKGKKDAKTRAGGRWSKATRDRLGIAAAAPRKSLASSGAGQQSLDSLLSRGADAAPEGAADDATAASGSGASPEEEFAEGDEADEMAAAARSNGDEETAEEGEGEGEGEDEGEGEGWGYRHDVCCEERVQRLQLLQREVGERAAAALGHLHSLSE